MSDRFEDATGRRYSFNTGHIDLTEFLYDSE
jgi:hypothetical protein